MGDLLQEALGGVLGAEAHDALDAGTIAGAASRFTAQASRRGSDLAVLGHPGAVVLADEVLEESRRLVQHDPRDSIEHRAQLLLGPVRGARSQTAMV